MSNYDHEYNFYDEIFGSKEPFFDEFSQGVQVVYSIGWFLLAEIIKNFSKRKKQFLIDPKHHKSMNVLTLNIYLYIPRQMALH